MFKIFSSLRSSITGHAGAPENLRPGEDIIAERLSEQLGHSLFVGTAGAGKSVLAEHLSHKLNGCRILLRDVFDDLPGWEEAGLWGPFYPDACPDEERAECLDALVKARTPGRFVFEWPSNESRAPSVLEALLDGVWQTIASTTSSSGAPAQPLHILVDGSSDVLLSARFASIITKGRAHSVALHVFHQRFGVLKGEMNRNATHVGVFRTLEDPNTALSWAMRPHHKHGASIDAVRALGAGEVLFWDRRNEDMPHTPLQISALN